MLTVYGRPQKLCDGVSRRSFLKIGAFAFGAAQFTLADVLRAEQPLGKTSHKAVINIFLGGGPPHQDMWDIKTEAPAEIRGEFKPIATNVPGIQIGEVLPEDRRPDGQVRVHPLASSARRGGHDAYPVHDRLAAASRSRPWAAGRASARSLSKLQGPVDPSVPPFVGLAAHDPARALVRLRHAGLPRPRLRRRSSPTARAWPNMKLNGVEPASSSADRKQAARQLRRPAPRAGRQRRPARRRRRTPSGPSACSPRASWSTRSTCRRKPRRSASATATASRTSSSTTARRRCNEHLLMARRLVEAGVRVRHAELRPLGQPRQELRPGPRPRRPSSTSASRRWSTTSTSAACSTT